MEYRAKMSLLAEIEDLDRDFSTVSGMKSDVLNSVADKTHAEALSVIKTTSPMLSTSEFFITGSLPESIVMKLYSSRKSPIALAAK